MDLSSKDKQFVRQKIATLEIPSSRLLIKDHRIIDDKGEYLFRLVITVTKFTTTFFKILYIGIKICQARQW